jgi:hypothetical protein
MSHAAMAPKIAVLDAKRKPDHIHVGQNSAENSGKPESRLPAQIRGGRLTEGRTHNGMRKKSGHAPDSFTPKGPESDQHQDEQRPRNIYNLGSGFWCLNSGMKRCLSIWLVLAAVSFAWAKDPEVLPPAFNGWSLDRNSVTTSSDPGQADAANASVLKEYGFADYETGTYTRNGHKIQVRAARFSDASGAYGAFTYYITPEMGLAKVGDRGAFNNSRILFYRGNILVDAKLDQVTAMSAADLRSLADTLPRPKGNTSALPTLPDNLPKRSLVSNSDRYIMGPVALERSGVPLPASLLDFSKTPEIEYAHYGSSHGEGALTLLEYPTPQIARDRLQALQSATLPGGPFYMKRSGPIVAVVNGSISQDEAQSLLALVNYDANVTLNEPVKKDEDIQSRIRFLFGVTMLVVIIVCTALVFGLAFGGYRVFARKLFPNRGFEGPEEVEIIRLNLR